MASLTTEAVLFLMASRWESMFRWNSRRSRLLAKAAAYSRNSPADWTVSGSVAVSDPVEVGVDEVEELELVSLLDGVL